MLDIYPVYVWRKGVVHWGRFGSGYIFDPHKLQFKFGDRPPRYSKIMLVDTSSYSGRTILKTEQYLEAIGYEVVNIYTETPRIAFRPQPIIALNGFACSGKSAIALLFQRELKGKLIKWGKVLRQHFSDIGEFGEKLTINEEFVVAKQIVNQLEKDVLYILDGIKDYDLLQFVGYATQKPIIPIWVIPSKHREFLCKWRQDFDDNFDRERIRFFKNRYKEFVRHALILNLNKNDHRVILRALGRFGLNIPHHIANSIFTPKFVIDFYYHNSMKVFNVSEDLIDKSWVFHTRYPEKHIPPLKRYPKLAQIVNILASAFRLIDDILDEDYYRRVGSDMIPTMWSQVGIWETLYRAIVMTSYALHQVNGAIDMFERVKRAVEVEIQADMENRTLTKEEYKITLDREIAFREWIASLIEYPVEKARKEAITAQIKNDLHATGKEQKRLKIS